MKGPPPAKKKSEPKKRPKRNKSAFHAAVENVHDRMVVAKRGGPSAWRDLKPQTLVGLYAHLHEQVYGVLPEELADDWYPALSTAKKFMAKQEGIDPVEFMRWVWQRERRSKIKNPENEFRISWRYQFSQKLVTDYKIHLLR